MAAPQSRLRRARRGATAAWLPRALPLLLLHAQAARALHSAPAWAPRDPLERFKEYDGGFAPQSEHYWAAQAFGGVACFAAGIAAFVFFAAALVRAAAIHACGCTSCRCCCGAEEPSPGTAKARRSAAVVVGLFAVCGTGAAVTIIVGLQGLGRGLGNISSDAVNTAEGVRDRVVSARAELYYASKALANATDGKPRPYGALELLRAEYDAVDAVEKAKDTADELRVYLRLLTVASWAIPSAVIFLALHGSCAATRVRNWGGYTLALALLPVTVLASFALAGMMSGSGAVLQDVCAVARGDPSGLKPLEFFVPCVPVAGLPGIRDKALNLEGQLRDAADAADDPKALYGHANATSRAMATLEDISSCNVVYKMFHDLAADHCDTLGIAVDVLWIGFLAAGGSLCVLGVLWLWERPRELAAAGMLPSARKPHVRAPLGFELAAARRDSQMANPIIAGQQHAVHMNPTYGGGAASPQHGAVYAHGGARPPPSPQHPPRRGM